MLQHVEELDRERNPDAAFRIDALFLVGNHCVVAIVMLNKDLFFIRRFDVIAASMIMDVAVAVDVVGRERGWALCVKV